MKQPNILFVMTDQQRQQSMGFWNSPPFSDYKRDCGDPVHTPNLDKFAGESVVFTQAVSNCPLCSPYRGMLMTGRFPMNNGVAFNCKAGRTSSLREDVVTITDLLAAKGYSIGYIGKYHLDMPEPHFDRNGNYVGEEGRFYSDGSGIGEDSCWDMVTPPGPKRHGVDFWYSYGTFDQHQNPHYWDSECNYIEPGRWSPSHEADVAVGYIENRNGQREEDQPFCLFVSMNPPHSPYDDIMYTDRESYEKHYSEEVVPRAEELLRRPNVTSESRADEMVRFYYSHITGVDREFGRILDALEREGYGEDTIVVYTSDHGDMMGSQGLLSKNVPYEESLLIPLLIRYPRVLKPSVEDLLIGVPDMMPTLLSLAGMSQSIPEDMDGTDYSGYIAGSSVSPAEKPASALYIHHYDEYQRKGVRTDRYTFVVEKDTEGEFRKYALFDNVKDPYQMNDLEMDRIPGEDLQFLLKELGRWLKKANDDWYKEGTFGDLIEYPQ